jgi:agmatinase
MAGRIPRRVATHGFGFGALESPVDWAAASVCVIPFPYDSTTTFLAGARRGPEAIFAASKNLELFDSELGIETWKVGLFTLDAVEPNINSALENSRVVESVVSDVLRAGKLPVSLGGDHSITLGCVRAVRQKHRDVGLLSFDAHPDLYDKFEGTRYGHANVARRVRELGVPLALVGVRSAARDEAEFMNRAKIPVVSSRDLLRSPEALACALSVLPKRVYVSIDLDVFDPSEMPAVGTPEPGGLRWYDMMEALQRVVAAKTVVAFDVVELCPIPGNLAPDFLACKLVYRLLGLIFRDRRQRRRAG